MLHCQHDVFHACHTAIYLSIINVSLNVLKFGTFSLSVLKKMVGFGAGIYKMVIRIANREDPYQTASSEAV